VNTIYTNETTGDPGLVKYLAASSGSTGNISAVLAQYMDSSGANAAPHVTYGGQYQIMPSIDPPTIFDSQIQRELVSQINAGPANGGLPRPAGDGLQTIYLLLFPAGQVECLDGSTCSGTQFCAYHGDAQLQDGTEVLYEVLPDNTTAPMSQVCGGASTPLANQTSYASHEWSEAITDPLVAEAESDSSKLAWYDGNCAGASPICGEIGDKCNAEQTQNGGWTVQLEWSNLESACEGSEPFYAAPTAAFTASDGGLVGQPVSVDGTGSSDPSRNTASATSVPAGTSYAINSGIAGYSWDWGDGTSPDTGATQTHSFSAPGTYQVSLTVTDNLGFTSTVTKPVEVSSTNPSPPMVNTGGTSDVGTQSATLDGAINTGGQPVSYSFAYGTSPDALSQSTSPAHLGPGVGSEPVSAAVTGLTPSATYYYELVVQDAGGQTYPGQVQSFTTKANTSAQGSGGSQGGSGGGGATPPPPPAPTPTPTPTPTPLMPGAVTGAAGGLSSSGATISGSVDPNGAPTSYLVEYGTSTAYGHSSQPGSAGAGTSSVSISATLSGLRPRTVYHYRVVATNSAGTAVGADRTFKTLAAAPRPPRFSFSAPSRITLAQAMSRKLRLRFHCSAACTAHFTVTLVLPGLRLVQAIPVTLARGTGRIARAGNGRATLSFTRAARTALRHASSVKLVISGYATRGASAPSTTRTLRLTLTR
jgi:PKD repeat protein